MLCPTSAIYNLMNASTSTGWLVLSKLCYKAVWSISLSEPMSAPPPACCLRLFISNSSASLAFQLALSSCTILHNWLNRQIPSSLHPPDSLDAPSVCVYFPTIRFNLGSPFCLGDMFWSTCQCRHHEEAMQTPHQKLWLWTHPYHSRSPQIW